MKVATVTPGKALQMISENDASYIECDLSGNATYAMKSVHFTKEIANSLARNTHLKRLTLSNLGITDATVMFIADALRENKHLTFLNLSKNNFGSEGLLSLADALTHNSTLLDIDLLGQTKPFGDAALARIIAMFNHNITLKNISWRLQSRQSFAINKLIVRNNEIAKRLASGKSVLDILPEPRRAEFGGEPSAVPTEISINVTTNSQASTESDYTSNDPIEKNHSNVSFNEPVAKPNIQLEPEKSETKNELKQPQVQLNLHTPSKPDLSKVSLSSTGGKMLNRYLQAAQQTGNSSANAPKNVASNSASKRSFFERQIEEHAQSAAKLTSRPQNIQRVATYNPKASAPMVETQKEPEKEVRTPTPKPLNSRVASIWKDKFESNQPENSTASAPERITSPRGNKVAELWAPKEEAVKKTEIDPITTGASKLASVWKQKEEEEEQRIQRENSKIPAGKGKREKNEEHKHEHTYEEHKHEQTDEEHKHEHTEEEHKHDKPKYEHEHKHEENNEHHREEHEHEENKHNEHHREEHKHEEHQQIPDGEPQSNVLGSTELVFESEGEELVFNIPDAMVVETPSNT